MAGAKNDVPAEALTDQAMESCGDKEKLFRQAFRDVIIEKVKNDLQTARYVFQVSRKSKTSTSSLQST
jgi:hypothetical protein